MKIQNILESISPRLKLLSVQPYNVGATVVSSGITAIDQVNGIKYSFDITFTNKSFNIEDVEVDDHGDYHEGDSEDNRILADYIKNNYKEILTVIKENQ